MISGIELDKHQGIFNKTLIYHEPGFVLRYEV